MIQIECKILVIGTEDTYPVQMQFQSGLTYYVCFHVIAPQLQKCVFWALWCHEIFDLAQYAQKENLTLVVGFKLFTTLVISA